MFFNPPPRASPAPGGASPRRPPPPGALAPGAPGVLPGAGGGQVTATYTRVEFPSDLKTWARKLVGIGRGLSRNGITKAAIDVSGP